MMKKPIAVVLLVSSALLALSSAQNRRVVIPPSAGGASKAAPEEILDANIAIELSGSLSGSVTMELVLVGCGTSYTADATVGEVEINDTKVPVLSTVNFKLSEGKDGTYIVSYRIGSRLPRVTSSAKGSMGGKVVSNITYEEVMIDGKVRCEVGKGITIFQAGGDALVLKVSAVEE